MLDRARFKWNGYGLSAHRSEWAVREEIWTWLAGQLGMPALLATPARSLSEVNLPTPKLSVAEIGELVELIGAESVRSDVYERAFHTHARDYPGLLALRAGKLDTAPDVVCYPRSSDEVMRLIAFAADNEIAVRPWGAGSAGLNNDKSPSIAIDLSAMNRALNAEDGVFEAGISGLELENALQIKGRALGHRPDAFEVSTLGGWIAWGAAEPSSLLYGTPRDWLLSAKVATPAGLFATDEAALLDLLVGSQGAFGIITEATVRTVPAPQARETRAFQFKEFGSADDALLRAMEEDLPIVAANITGSDDIYFWNGASGEAQRPRAGLSARYKEWRGFDRKAVTLCISFEGTARAVDGAAVQFAILAAKAGGIAAKVTDTVPIGYLRDTLMDRGVGMETFSYDVNWQRISEFRAQVSSVLENALVERSPTPGARGITLSSVSALSPDKARLTYMYIFPRLLDAELEQWQALRAAIARVAPPQARSATEKNILHSIKAKLDPRNILPAVP